MLKRMICSAFLLVGAPVFASDSRDSCRQLSGFMEATGVAQDMGIPMSEVMDWIPKGETRQKQAVEGLLLELVGFAYGDGRRVSPSALAGRMMVVCMNVMGREG